MSATAEFLKLSISALASAAPADISRLGKPVVDFPWSGYVLPVALCYLQERKQIDLLHSEFDPVSTALTKSAGTTHVILTNAHRAQFFEKLSMLPPESELRDYFNEFNGGSETGAGKPMAAGIEALRSALAQIDKDSVVVVVVG